MKYEKIIDLLREVEKSGVEEFELEKENFRIRIKKSSGSSREPEGEAQPLHAAPAGSLYADFA